MKIPRVLLHIVSFAFLLLAHGTAHAEGSWQFGLLEGVTHAQPLFEYNNSYNASATGLQAELRPLYVDLLSDSEVINISLCGTADSSDIEIQVWDEAGTTQLNTTFTAASGNVPCADDFTGNLGTPYQFAPGTAGTYQLRFFNNSGNGSAGVFLRFDVTVTPDAATPVDPRLNQGRLWAYRWAFRCTEGGVCYQASRATSVDLYAVVAGGFTDTYYVWQLDLNVFAGFAYEITANSIGLDSPNPDGNVVAGLSACIDTDDDPSDGCGNISGNRNTVAAVYPLYTSDPVKPYPRPTEPPQLSNFRFLDDAGVDDSISPGETINVQDTGNFLFTTNLVTEGTYQIVIDINGDGDYGVGDVFLGGIATPGDNPPVNWDGKDNSGNITPSGNYNARIVLKTGEFHFTAADAETSGGPGNNGLTINAVLDDGTIDSSNLVYWDDATVLQLGGANAYNADGAARYHNWGNFSSGGDGNRAYIDTYVVGAFSAPVLTRIEVEDDPVSDVPKTRLLGSVFEDLDGDGVRDPGEPGIANVVVAIMEQASGPFFVSTDVNGDYQFFTSDATVTVDVDESTLPAGYTQTAGTDPQVFAVTPGVDNDLGLDGFRAPPPPEPPAAVADSSTDNVVGTPVTVDVLGNDSDPNNDIDPTKVQIVGTAAAGDPLDVPGEGQWTVDPATGAITFTPCIAAGVPIAGCTGPFTGDPTPIQYTVSDTGGLTSAPAQVSVGYQSLGSVSGLVFNDLDGDGVRDAGDAGLAGVTLELLDGSGAVIATTTAAADGSYSFNDLPAGDYSVRETDLAGFVSTTANTLPVTVPAGGSATADFGDQGQGTVSGLVFDDIDGDGIADAGETGLAGVTIELVDNTGAVIDATTTVADGSYIFTDVPEGSYTVRETDPVGYVSTTLNDAIVSVAPAGAAVADFGDLGQGIISGLVFDDANGDGSQSAGEAGLPGVTIELLDDTGTVTDTTTTAADGSYNFDPVGQGAYIVRETDPAGYVSTTGNDVPVSVAPGGAAVANFGDLGQGTVSGTVYDDTNGDGSQDAGEAGLAGVTIELLDASGAVVATTTTAADGSYIFAGVDQGSYSVSETDPAGYVSTTTNDVPISVAPGGAAVANFGDLGQGAVSGTVYNDVNGDGSQDAAEAGLSGVVIELIDASDAVVATTTTALDGSYSFSGVAQGSYTVRETDPSGFVSTTNNDVPISVAPGGAATANFGDLGQGTVSGTVFTDLNGDGSQGAGEMGLGGVVVELVDASGAVVATTATVLDGSYLFNGVDQGDYTVRESDPAGYVSTTNNEVPVSVPPNGSETANFGDLGQGSVSGNVFNDGNGDGIREAGEAGLGGVLVELLDDTGAVVATTTTTLDGSYGFSGVAEGNYIVRETDPSGYVSTTANDLAVSVPPNGSAVANFGDLGQGTLSGTVYNDGNGDGSQDAGEAGLGGVTVQLLDDTGAVVATTATALDGSYSFTGVDQGNYTVRELDPAGYFSTTANDVPVSVAPDGSAVANFGDLGQGLISGAVYNDSNGDGSQGAGEAGLGGVTVQLLDASGGVVATTTTTIDGSYSFSGVAQGSYTVRETDPSGFVSTTNNDVPISVAPGGAATANFGDLGQGTVSGTVFTDLNGDGSQGAGEMGLGGVVVELLDASGAVVATTATVLDGSYLFNGVDQGDYTVRESDPAGYVSTTNNEVPVIVPPNGSETANFGDLGQGSVSGNVFNDGNGDGIREAGEAGLGGVLVELLDDTGAVVATTTTTLDGSYGFSGVAEGNYIVRETDPSGYVSTTANDLAVSVPPNGSAVANFGDLGQGTLSGTVYNDGNGDGSQDAGEAGLGGVTVQLLDDTGAVVATTATALDGSYSFTGVDQGNYTVRELDPAGYFSTTANDVPVSVAPDGSAVANFGDLGQGLISGAVYNDSNGDGSQGAGEAGLGGVTVQLLDASGGVVATTTTTIDGSYSFSGVDQGDYTVQELDPAGYVSTTSNDVPVVVPANGSATASFGDLGQGTVSGMVFSDNNGDGSQAAGEPGIGGVIVELLDDAGIVVATTTTTVDGSYSFTDVVEGNYTVRELDPAGYVSTTANVAPVSIPPGAGGTATANFGDLGQGAVSGTVFTDADGDGVQVAAEAGIGGVTVELVNDTGTLVATTTTALDGSYSFAGVTQDSYVVRETDPAGYVSTTGNAVPVSVPVNGSATANFGDRQPGVGLPVIPDTDGDGVSDNVDPDPGLFDPTGFFYDEATGNIIPGGNVTVSGPAGADITITLVDGYYQWFTDPAVPGAYVMTITPPPGYRPSAGCLPQGTIVPDGVVSLGAMKAAGSGTPGALTDNGCTNFHLEFVLDAGDFVLYNNIPLQRLAPGQIPAQIPTLSPWSLLLLAGLLAVLGAAQQRRRLP